MKKKRAVCLTVAGYLPFIISFAHFALLVCNGPLWRAGAGGEGGGELTTGPAKPCPTPWGELGQTALHVYNLPQLSLREPQRSDLSTWAVTSHWVWAVLGSVHSWQGPLYS